MMHTLKWSFLFVFIFLGNAYAKTDKELRDEFTKIIMTCTMENVVEIKDLMKLQQLEVPNKREVMCLLACGYKKIGTLNSKGLYDVQGGYKMAELVRNGSTPEDEERFQNAKKLVDICSKVNDESVSDGEKGCDRAALMFKCGVENAPKLGFELM